MFRSKKGQKLELELEERKLKDASGIDIDSLHYCNMESLNDKKVWYPVIKCSISGIRAVERQTDRYVIIVGGSLLYDPPSLYGSVVALGQSASNLPGVTLSPVARQNHPPETHPILVVYHPRGLTLEILCPDYVSRYLMEPDGYQTAVLRF